MICHKFKLRNVKVIFVVFNSPNADTIKLIKLSSSHDVDLLKCPTVNILLSSLFTAGNKCNNSLHPYICIVFKRS